MLETYLWNLASAVFEMDFKSSGSSSDGENKGSVFRFLSWKRISELKVYTCCNKNTINLL